MQTSVQTRRCLAVGLLFAAKIAIAEDIEEVSPRSRVYTPAETSHIKEMQSRADAYAKCLNDMTHGFFSDSSTRAMGACYSERANFEAMLPREEVERVMGNWDALTKSMDGQ